jgi:acetyl-CoA carboxylase biotin carboxyl carrier protein
MNSVSVKSEITGSVCTIVATEGAAIDVDDTILLIESMKMEIPAQAPVAGVVTRIHVAEGDTVSEGDIIATIESV